MMTEDLQLLSQKARDILLAETLGDVHRLNIQVEETNRRIAELLQHLEVGERRNWLSLLDNKMREFQQFQIPEIAAAKLQKHAEIFLRGLMAEVRRLVAQEAATQSAYRPYWWAFFGFGLGILVAFGLRIVA